MKAPRIAGRYQFKMFLSDNFPVTNAVNADGTLNPIVSTIPAENWPVMLVKGEVDPGIIEGTIRYGSWNQALYNLPIQLPGRVRAVGVADDPYTGASTGRMVEARGYFNATAKGHYEVEGIAPGVYDIYASAAGYPEMKVASGVKIIAGKSFHADYLLQPGPIITGVLYSKHSFGEVPWPSTRPVTVEIYDSNEWPSAKPGYDWDSAGMTWEAQHLKSFSPINLTDSPYTSYVTGNVIYDPGKGYADLKTSAGNLPKLVAFPWEGPKSIDPPVITWINGQPVATEYQTEVGAGDTTTDKDVFGLFNGVGPAQYWWVDNLGAYTNGGGTNSFRYQFGIKGFYGAPMEFDGHVPQVYATWVNGMTAGQYYTRGWINGYVQTDVSGTYVDYPFTVAADEWAGDINTPMDLETASWINKTVHFHDLPGTLQTSPIRGPDPWRYLIAEAYDADNVLVAMNFTQVPATYTDANITLNGFGMAGPVVRNYGEQNDGTRGPGVPNGMKFSMYRYRNIRDYGIMPGTYSIRVYMRGYVQQEFEMASISLSQSPALISNHMYRGAGINVTVYSIDWEHPRTDKYWTFSGDDVRVYVLNSAGTSMNYIKYFSNTQAQPRWSTPGQKAGVTTIPFAGTPYTDAGKSKLKYNGSWEVDSWGPDAEGWLPGYYYDTDWYKYLYTGSTFSTGIAHHAWGFDGTATKTDAQTGIWLEFGYDKYGFLANPGRYRNADRSTKLALETGTYTLKGYTLGYVQKKDITVYAQKGQQSDTKLNLAQGVNITVNIKFKKEGIFSELPYNSSFRIRVFDDNGALVATWFTTSYDKSGFYTGVIQDGIKAYGGYGTGKKPYSSSLPNAGADKNWVEDHTNELQVLFAGNYLFQEIDQYATVPKDNRWSTFYGIDGWPNYQGNYHVEVDAVNLYQSTQSFPAPQGLLAR